MARCTSRTESMDSVALPPARGSAHRAADDAGRSRRATRSLPGWLYVSPMEPKKRSPLTISASACRGSAIVFEAPVTNAQAPGRRENQTDRGSAARAPSPSPLPPSDDHAGCRAVRADLRPNLGTRDHSRASCKIRWMQTLPRGRHETLGWSRLALGP
jgi:hypothetical protein